jgi:hypothetical protein
MCDFLGGLVWDGKRKENIKEKNEKRHPKKFPKNPSF